MNTSLSSDPFILYGETFKNRLFLGTSRYPSPSALQEAIKLAQPGMLTASLRRQTSNAPESGQQFWNLLKSLNIPILPNTAGCHSIKEVITTAEMAREVFETDWVKLELIGDDYTLQPDTLNIIEAAGLLIQRGFRVLPYCTEDLVVCQGLIDAGCQALMPWAAPIGTGKGPINGYALRSLRDRLEVPMIIDAGLGVPSHVCQVMEWGFDGVLLNTAVALAQNPIKMADAFSKATQAGRSAFLSGAMEEQNSAQTSTPVLGTPFWHHS